MSDSMTSLDQLYQAYSNELNDSNVTKTQFINKLNLLLLRILPTKPAEMLTPLYYVDGYEKYSIPSQGFRDPIAIYTPTSKVICYVSPFRYNLNDPATSFTDQGVAAYRYLKVKNPNNNSKAVVFTLADNLTNDGAWTIAGGVNIQLDPYVKLAGAGSLKFTINTDQCILTFDKTNVVDASDFTDNMRLRFNAWLPAKPTSIKVRLGNDSTHYFEQSITTQVSGEPINLLSVNEFEFAQEQSTMTALEVDKANIDFLEIEFNFSAAISTPNFRINKIYIAKPEIMNFEWYTSYVAIDSNGVLKQLITASEDSTDEPIVKDYPVYISTVLDGLIYDELKIKDPERAKGYYNRFVGEKENNNYINGLGLIRKMFPNRRTNYRRMKTLPDLNYTGINNNSTYYTDRAN